MAIDFACPHCGHRTIVADEYAGQTGPCKSCGKSITVPAAAPPGYGPAPVKPPPGYGTPPHYGSPPPGYGPQPGYAVPPSKTGSPRATGPVIGITLAVGGLLLLMCCGGLGFAGYYFAREGSTQNTCRNNLRQIAIAFHNYQDVMGKLPPIYVADADGKPLHSWRVLLLPYLEQSNLYQQIRLSEPWDSPHNSQFHNQMPSVYACPADGDLPPGMTSYLAIGGFTGPITGPTPPLLPPPPGGASPLYDASGGSANTSSQTGLSSIVDGTSNTILVVEAAGSRVNWMEPVDLDLKGNYTVSTLADGQHISSQHRGGVNVAMCDASVTTLPTTTDAETLQRLIMKDDGMVVSLP